MEPTWWIWWLLQQCKSHKSRKSPILRRLGVIVWYGYGMAPEAEYFAVAGTAGALEVVCGACAVLVLF